jgi:YD repeat-containing protein
VQYDYDALGNVVKETPLQNGSNNFLGFRTYTYDAKNRLATIADTKVGTFGFGYDAMDWRTSLTYPNGVTTSYAYDNAYRITSIATKNAVGNIVDGWSYQYDSVGNRISKTDMDGKVESDSYDNTYRLTEARYADGTREAFTYDPVGNRMTRTDESGTTAQYSYDIANQMLKVGNDTFVYDANGSMTSTHGCSRSIPIV